MWEVAGRAYPMAMQTLRLPRVAQRWRLSLSEQGSPGTGFCSQPCVDLTSLHHDHCLQRGKTCTALVPAKEEAGAQHAAPVLLSRPTSLPWDRGTDPLVTHMPCGWLPCPPPSLLCPSAGSAQLVFTIRRLVINSHCLIKNN